MTHRLITKDSRQQVRDYDREHFRAKYPETFEAVEFGRLEIQYWNDGKHNLRIYRGTAAHPMTYYYYRTPEQAVEAIDKACASEILSLDYRQKQDGSRKPSSQASAAQAIREELKKVFPSVKFAVRSSSFSMGDSVNVSWELGPTTDEVDAIIQKYQHGYFDGMTDCYNYVKPPLTVTPSGAIERLPSAKYVQTSRNIPENVRERVKALYLEFYGLPEGTTSHCGEWIDTCVHRALYKAPIYGEITGLSIIENQVRAVTAQTPQEQPQ